MLSSYEKEISLAEILAAQIVERHDRRADHVTAQSAAKTAPERPAERPSEPALEAAEDAPGRREPRTGGGVQSLDRAFAILETMADAGGVISLSQLAADAQLPLPTIHRLVRTLVDLGYVRQEPSRQYSLGPRLIRLGETTSRMLGTWARPHMTKVVAALGESVNLAILDSDQIVYVGQVMASQNSMRMFTEVGRRVEPHSTAVGKAILANEDPAEVRALLARTGMAARTEHTITTPEAFLAELERTRQRGYALDDGEQEVGVRCVAVAVPDAPQPIALSMSGPMPRMTDDVIKQAAPLLTEAAEAISRELRAGHR
jgi:IclR family acetate operon transcriptional repressor